MEPHRENRRTNEAKHNVMGTQAPSPMQRLNVDHRATMPLQFPATLNQSTGNTPSKDLPIAPSSSSKKIRAISTMLEFAPVIGIGGYVVAQYASTSLTRVAIGSALILASIFFIAKDMRK